MDMNNMRNESHVAQKNRRHKLRFQQTNDDPTHHQHVPDNPRYGSICYDPNVFPSEMLNSIASNPHLLFPPNHVYVDQDTGSGSVSGSDRVSGKVVGENSQTVGSWKSVDSSKNQVQVSNDWNVISYVNSNSKACYGYSQDMESHNLGEQKNPGEVPGFNSSPFYQNTLQDVVTTATIGSNVHQSIPIWMNGSDQVGFIGSRNNGNNCVAQRLSLSLSSVPQPKSEYPNAYLGPKVISDPKQFTGISSFAHRSVGPLGPFTGYATILKNSKYLKPAQELLNDSCDVGGQELVPTCDDTHKILEEELSRVSGESGASSSTIYGSNEHLTGRSSSLSESCRPEFHQKKAKLLYMQEEVCRRYKQYHQQMQMVISSFETVAGLTTATPYVSLALKSVSRHFHFVKNAISEQLTQMKKTFDDMCSPTVGASSSKTLDGNTTESLSQLKSMDYFQIHGKSSGGPGFYGNQQPVWRPQRGLPERAVSVLKAWLFDHFLHPYPSDADKHMLATQTGLTRNQVSNWFINARVRIWKPMVEEIHTLETKGLADTNSNNPQTDGQETSQMDMSSLTNKQQPECSRTKKQQPECSRTSGTLTTQNETSVPEWDHEKQPRQDYHQIPSATLDRSFTHIIPYPRTTFEAGGVGPVSLTLGLRQNAEHVQQLQQHEHQLRQRFGGQLIHDFVG